MESSNVIVSSPTPPNSTNRSLLGTPDISGSVSFSASTLQTSAVEVNELLSECCDLRDDNQRQGHELRRAQADLADLRSQLETAVRALDQEHRTRHAVDEEITSTKIALKTAMAEAATANARAEDLEVAVLSAHVDAKNLRDINSRMEGDLSTARSDAQQLSEKIVSQQRLHSVAESQATAKAKVIAELRSELLTARSEIDNLSKQVSRSITEAESAKRSERAAQSCIDSLRKDFSQLNRCRDDDADLSECRRLRALTVEAELTASHDHNAKYREEIEDLQSRLAAALSEADDLKRQRQEAIDEAERLQEAYNDSTLTLKAVRDETDVKCESLRTSIDQCMSNLRRKEIELASAIEEKQAANEIVKSLRQDLTTTRQESAATAARSGTQVQEALKAREATKAERRRAEDARSRCVALESRVEELILQGRGERELRKRAEDALSLSQQRGERASADVVVHTEQLDMKQKLLEEARIEATTQREARVAAERVAAAESAALHKAKEDADASQRMLGKRATECVALRQELTKAGNRLTELESLLSAATERKDALESAADVEREARSTLKQALTDARAQVDHLSANSVNLEMETDSLQVQLTAKADEVSALSLAIASVECERDDLEATLATTKDKVRNLTSDLEDARNEATSASDASSECQRLRESLGLARTKLRSCELREEQCRTALEVAELRSEEADIATQQERSARDAADSSVSLCRIRISELESECDAVGEKLRHATSDSQVAQASIDSLRESKSGLEKDLTCVRLELQDTVNQRDDLQRRVDTLMRLASVAKEELRDSVAAQAIVETNLTTAKDELERMALSCTSTTNRAESLAGELNRVENALCVSERSVLELQKRFDALRSEKGVVDTRVVEVEANWRGCQDQLRHSQSQLHREMSESRQRCTQDTTTIADLQANVNELKNNLTEEKQSTSQSRANILLLESQLNDTRIALSKCQEQLATQQNQVKILTDARSAADAVLVTSQRVAHDRGVALETLSNRIDELTHALAVNKEAHTVDRANAAALRAELEHLKQDYQQLQNDCSSMRQLVQRETESKVEYAEALKRCEDKLSVALTNIGRLEIDCEEKTARLDSTCNELVLVKTEMESLSAQLLQMQTSQVGLRKDLSRAQHDSKEHEANISSAREECSVLTHEITTLQGQIHDLSGALESAQLDLNHAETVLAEQIARSDSSTQQSESELTRVRAELKETRAKVMSAELLARNSLQELDNARSEREQHERTLHVHTQRSLALDQQCDQLRTEVTHLKQAAQAQTEVLERAQTDFNDVTATLKAAQARAEALRDAAEVRAHAAEQGKDAAISSRKQMERELAELVDAQDNMSMMFRDAKTGRETVEKELVGAQQCLLLERSKKQSLQERFEKLSADHRELGSLVSHLKADAIQMKGQLDQLRNHADVVEEQKTALQIELQAKSDDFAECVAKVTLDRESTSARIETSRRTEARLADALDEMSQRATTAEVQISELQQQIARLNNELDAARHSAHRLCEAATAEVDTVRSSRLEALQRSTNNSSLTYSGELSGNGWEVLSPVRSQQERTHLSPKSESKSDSNLSASSSSNQAHLAVGALIDQATLLRTEVSASYSQAEVSDEEAKRAHARADRLSLELSKAVSETSGKCAELEKDLIATQSQLEKTRNELQATIADATRNKANQAAERTSLLEDLHNARDQVASLETARKEAAAASGDERVRLQSENERLSRELKDLRGALDAATKTVDAQIMDSASKCSEIEKDLIATQSQLEKTRNELQATIADATRNKANQAAERTSLLEDLHNARDQVASLETARKEAAAASGDERVRLQSEHERLSRELKDLRGALDAATKTVDAQIMEIAAERTKSTNLGSDLQDISQELHQHSLALSVANTRIDELQAGSTITTNRLMTEHSTSTALERRAIAAESVLAAHSSKTNALVAQVSNFETEIASVTANLRASVTREIELKSKLAVASEGLTTANQTLQDAHNNLNATANALRDAEGRADALSEALLAAEDTHSECDKIIERAERAESALATSSTQVDDLVRRIKDIQTNHDSTLQELSDAHQALDRQQQRCASLQREVESALAEKIKAQQEFSEMQSRVVILESEVVATCAASGKLTKSSERWRLSALELQQQCEAGQRERVSLTQQLSELNGQLKATSVASEVTNVGTQAPNERSVDSLLGSEVITVDCDHDYKAQRDVALDRILELEARFACLSETRSTPLLSDTDEEVETLRQRFATMEAKVADAERLAVDATTRANVSDREACAWKRRAREILPHAQRATVLAEQVQALRSELGAMDVVLSEVHRSPSPPPLPISWSGNSVATATPFPPIVGTATHEQVERLIDQLVGIFQGWTSVSMVMGFETKDMVLVKEGQSGLHRLSIMADDELMLLFRLQHALAERVTSVCSVVTRPHPWWSWQQLWQNRQQQQQPQQQP